MAQSSIPVSDFLSNVNDQLAAAARILGRSKHRQAVFETIYRGQKQIKTIQEIMAKTHLSQTHVLKEGGKMAGLLVEKVPGGYRKKNEFATRYKTILAMARDKKKLDSLPTKTAPKLSVGGRITVSFPRLGQNAKLISIDEIESFSPVRTQDPPSKIGKPLREKKLKNAFAKIIGEKGSFKDWGGEKSDLYTTKLRWKGRKVAAAIAFKGKATKGKLVPKKMGTNGDQINRLFQEPAQIFLVVYWGQIESSIISQMQAFAIGNALKGGKVYYGVVDGSDLARLAAAYPDHFSAA
jgi:hypothetical protein